MKKIKYLGVANATPNSFSDGHLNLDPNFQKRKLNSFLEASYGLDLGAESTAPFNDPISENTEWERLEKYVLENLETLKKFHTISIDTYRATTMKRFMQEYAALFQEVVWNDVSGVVDASCIHLLQSYPHLKYILCHNLAPERSLAGLHMKYAKEKLTSIDIAKFFKLTLEELSNNGVELNRIILDPCFGFSKTLEQNLEILKTISDIFEIHPHWLIGISKKSFLQFLVDSEGKSKQEKIELSEAYHWRYLKELEDKFSNVVTCKSLYFRVHEIGNITA